MTSSSKSKSSISFASSTPSKKTSNTAASNDLPFVLRKSPPNLGAAHKKSRNENLDEDDTGLGSGSKSFEVDRVSDDDAYDQDKDDDDARSDTTIHNLANKFDDLTYSSQQLSSQKEAESGSCVDLTVDDETTEGNLDDFMKEMIADVSKSIIPRSYGRALLTMQKRRKAKTNSITDMSDLKFWDEKDGKIGCKLCSYYRDKTLRWSKKDIEDHFRTKSHISKKRDIIDSLNENT